MNDKIETLGIGSIIQHGKLNDRIYLMKLNKDDFPSIIEKLNSLAKEKTYTKIFCKVPSWAAPSFLADGFITEAQIPDFYNNRVDVFFMSKFLSADRFLNPEHEHLDDLCQQLISASPTRKSVDTPALFCFKELTVENAEEIADLYKKVFESYPFPIFDPAYIRSSLVENVQYFGIELKGELIALSSAEVDKKGQNVEMTDFATLPTFRGNKLSGILLKKMELEMKKQGITTLYTIARLNSTAMNKTFQNLNYKYAGTLIKNTNISGKIESMNVYYKHL